MTTLRDFETAVEKLFDIEGFTSDLKGDPGGYTIWGITEKYFPKIIKRLKDLPPDQSKQKAKVFYYEQFWVRYKCYEMEYPYNMVYFIQLVNAPAKSLEYKNVAKDWKDFLMMFIDWQNNDTRPGRTWDNKGLINRAIRVWKFVLGDEQREGK